MNNELIEAAKAVIARWDSTDWKAAPTAEVMNRLRAALSAKPESECAACGGDGFIYYETGGVDMDGENDTRECHREDCLDCSGEPEPAKLPEVEEWIIPRSNIADEFDFNTWVITVVDVRRYIQQLTAAHAAELAEKDAEIERRKRLLRDVCPF